MAAEFQPCAQLKIEPVDLMGVDQLDVLFNMQKNLVKKYYTPNLGNMTEDELNEWMKNLVLALHSEVNELQDQIRWKWYKKKYVMNEKEIRFELIDIFKFVLTAMIARGMTPKDLVEYYMAKYEENVRRQESGEYR